MKSQPRYLYLLLLLYVAASLTYYAANIAGFVDGVWFHHARVPFDVNFETVEIEGLQPEATAAGLVKGDVIESLNGERYGGLSQWVRVARHREPGTPLHAGASR